MTTMKNFSAQEGGESVHPCGLDVQNQIYRNIYPLLAFLPAIPSCLRRLLVRKSQHTELLTIKILYPNS